MLSLFYSRDEVLEWLNECAKRVKIIQFKIYNNNNNNKICLHLLTKICTKSIRSFVCQQNLISDYLSKIYISFFMMELMRVQINYFKPHYIL